jgi:hypothetical protein
VLLEKASYHSFVARETGEKRAFAMHRVGQ